MTRMLLLFVFVFQAPAALAPERLAPDVISTSAIETDGTFLPDGQTMFFSRRPGQWGEEMQYSAIYVSRLTGNGWTPPVVADFSGEWSDDDVFAAPDGRTVVFVSQRPTPDGDDHDRDIWMTAATADGWGEATHLPAPVSSPALDIGPSLAANGTLYFASDRAGGHGSGDLYRARRVDGRYPEVENLGPVVNGPSGEWNVLVAPDESFLIFESAGRAGNLGAGGDLYLSYRTGEAWGPPIHLDAISTPGSDLMARISPDGSRLYYSTTFAADGTDADIVSVPLAALLARYPRP